MAKAISEIIGRIEFRKEEGDGTICSHCGDVAWLIQHRCVLVSNVGELNLGFALCNSCGEAYQQSQ